MGGGGGRAYLSWEVLAGPQCPGSALSGSTPSTASCSGPSRACPARWPRCPPSPPDPGGPKPRSMGGEGAEGDRTLPALHRWTCECPLACAHGDCSERDRGTSPLNPGAVLSRLEPRGTDKFQGLSMPLINTTRLCKHEASCALQLKSRLCGFNMFSSGWGVFISGVRTPVFLVPEV